METTNGHAKEEQTKIELPLSGSIEPCLRDHEDHRTRSKDKKKMEKVASREVVWPKLICFCNDCGIDHLPRDCPLRPIAREPSKRTSLNMVEIIKNPS